jgi:hypothetical protein
MSTRTQLAAEGASSPLWQRIGGRLRARLSDLNIRMKIISPYLLLTLGVAVIGIYVVTSLVFKSIDERLTNHTIQAGRVVSNQLAGRKSASRMLARASAMQRASPT